MYVQGMQSKGDDIQGPLGLLQSLRQVFNGSLPGRAELS